MILGNFYCCFTLNVSDVGWLKTVDQYYYGGNSYPSDHHMLNMSYQFSLFIIAQPTIPLRLLVSSTSMTRLWMNYGKILARDLSVLKWNFSITGGGNKIARPDTK